MKKVILLLVLFTLVLSSCQIDIPDPKEEFDLSLIPGIYSGGLFLITLDDSTGLPNTHTPIKMVEYMTTILKNEDSFTFIFDPECIMQIPNIEVFQSERYFYTETSKNLSISSIISENFKKRTDLGQNQSLAWTFYNFFEQGIGKYNMDFDLLLESTKSDTVYCLEIFGSRKL